MEPSIRMNTDRSHWSPSDFIGENYVDLLFLRNCRSSVTLKLIINWVNCLFSDETLGPNLRWECRYVRSISLFLIDEISKELTINWSCSSQLETETQTVTSSRRWGTVPSSQPPASPSSLHSDPHGNNLNYSILVDDSERSSSVSQHCTYVYTTFTKLLANVQDNCFCSNPCRIYHSIKVSSPLKLCHHLHHV